LDLLPVGDGQVGDGQTEVDKVVGRCLGGNLTCCGNVLTVIGETTSDDLGIEGQRSLCVAAVVVVPSVGAVIRAPGGTAGVAVVVSASIAGVASVAGVAGVSSTIVVLATIAAIVVLAAIVVVIGIVVVVPASVAFTAVVVVGVIVPTSLTLSTVVVVAVVIASGSGCLVTL